GPAAWGQSRPGATWRRRARPARHGDREPGRGDVAAASPPAATWRPRAGAARQPRAGAARQPRAGAARQPPAGPAWRPRVSGGEGGPLGLGALVERLGVAEEAEQAGHPELAV